MKAEADKDGSLLVLTLEERAIIYVPILCLPVSQHLVTVTHEVVLLFSTMIEIGRTILTCGKLILLPKMSRMILILVLRLLWNCFFLFFSSSEYLTVMWLRTCCLKIWHWCFEYFKAQRVWENSKKEGHQPPFSSPFFPETGHETFLWGASSLYSEGRNIHIPEDKRMPERILTSRLA